MESIRFSVIPFAVLALGLIAALGVTRGWSSGSIDPSETTASASNLTPAPGNPLRKAVLDGLRHELKRLQGVEVIFVVRHLKVKDGWAWTHTLPQSKDGKSKYEDISALLVFRDGGWTVVEILCTEEENPNCYNGPEYFDNLKKRFPEVTIEIFPVWSAGRED